MYIRIFIISILFSMGSIYPQSFSSGDINEYLDKTYENIGLGDKNVLQFKSNNTYETTYASEWAWYYNSGTFEFKGGYIYLKPLVCKETKSSDKKLPCSFTLGEVKIEINNRPNDLYFLEYLRFTPASDSTYLSNNGEFFMGVTGKEVPEGSKRIYKNVNVVTMGMLKGITTSDVKLRETPELDGKVIPFQAEMFSEATLKAVPVGSSVTVIARTEEKMSIQKWNNYWYLVNVGFHQQVWMYGEFVKLD